MTSYAEKRANAVAMIKKNIARHEARLERIMGDRFKPLTGVERNRWINMSLACLGLEEDPHANRR